MSNTNKPETRNQRIRAHVIATLMATCGREESDSRLYHIAITHILAKAQA